MVRRARALEHAESPHRNVATGVRSGTGIARIQAYGIIQPPTADNEVLKSRDRNRSPIRQVAHALKVVNKEGKGLVLDLLIGVVGAEVGGWLFHMRGMAGVTRLSVYSLVVAVIGAVVQLCAYHALTRHRVSLQAQSTAPDSPTSSKVDISTLARMLSQAFQGAVESRATDFGGA